MNYRKVFILAVLLLVFQLFTSIPKIEAKAQQPKILMVYMTEDGLPTANIHLWEATFSAFTNELQLIAADQIDSVAAVEQDVVVFIGEERGTVPQTFQAYLQQFTGKIIAFGHNVAQLQAYTDWRFTGEEQLRTLDGTSLSTALFAQQFIPPKQHEVLSAGRTLYEEVPFIAKAGRHTYIASTSIGMAEKLAVSRSIYQMLNIPPPKEHPAYIRLEDISPISNPQLVQEAGDYLIERGIPFSMAVTTVYIGNEDEGQIRLADNEALVEVLQNLQGRGGVVIAHGYADDQRATYKGGRFEFWDATLNQKITTLAGNERTAPLKSQFAFPTREAYELYMTDIDAIEKQYIDQRHIQAIEQLAALDLYPLAFAVPYHAMSSNGYQVTSTYFGSIFGQLQLSDEDREVTNVPLFLSTPAILSGMTLYPETIGFVNTSLEYPLGNMESAIRQLEDVPGSVIGGIYHAYLGLDYLSEMVDLIESVGNIKWIDLQQTTQIAQTEHITIRQEPGESLEVISTFSRLDAMLQQLKERPFEASLWIMAIVVGLFIVAFFIYISGLRVRLRKRLFEEREQIG